MISYMPIVPTRRNATLYIQDTTIRHHNKTRWV